MAYHASPYRNTIACACQVVVQRDNFIFCQNTSYHRIIFCKTQGIMELLCFPWQLQSVVLAKRLTFFGGLIESKVIVVR